VFFSFQFFGFESGITASTTAPTAFAPVETTVAPVVTTASATAKTEHPSRQRQMASIKKMFFIWNGNKINYENLSIH
jgi:hypothetical protein